MVLPQQRRGAHVVPLGYRRVRSSTACHVGKGDMAGFRTDGLEDIAVGMTGDHVGAQVLVRDRVQRGQEVHWSCIIDPAIELIMVHGPTHVRGARHEDGPCATIVNGGEVDRGVGIAGGAGVGAWRSSLPAGVDSRDGVRFRPCAGIAERPDEGGVQPSVERIEDHIPPGCGQHDDIAVRIQFRAGVPVYHGLVGGRVHGNVHHVRHRGRGDVLEVGTGGIAGGHAAGRIRYLDTEIQCVLADGNLLGPVVDRIRHTVRQRPGPEGIFPIDARFTSGGTQRWLMWKIPVHHGTSQWNALRYLEKEGGQRIARNGRVRRTGSGDGDEVVVLYRRVRSRRHMGVAGLRIHGHRCHQGIGPGKGSSVVHFVV